MIVNFLQNKIKVFLPPLALVYRDGWEWWASVELGRRLLFILLTVSLPQNLVGFSIVTVVCSLPSFILQGIHALFLAVYTTVHGYIQPYRSLLANLLEIAVNVNFLLLPLISTTRYFCDSLFIFPAHTVSEHSTDKCDGIHNNIAQVAWILMPVYYL